MNQGEQTTLTERAESRDRVRLDMSRESYLSILFCVEEVLKRRAGASLYQDNYHQAEQVIAEINDLSIALAELSITHFEYEGRPGAYLNNNEGENT